MNIRTNVNHKLRQQIFECIQLLGEDYSNLPYIIDIYTNRERLEYERKNKPVITEVEYDQILNGSHHPPGQTISEKNVIRLYLFNLDDINNENLYKIEIIANVFHEVRHTWQQTHHLYMDEPELQSIDDNIDDNKEAYFNLPSEKDAYSFQEQQFDKHKLKISEIMNMTSYIKKYELKDDIKQLIGK
ncbi:hypothetical protein SAMN05428981_11056 [Bacillus sp. OV194]|nr:hypothetical protein SAMN05428981_11056 [Bacillus sp. OV194]